MRNQGKLLHNYLLHTLSALSMTFFHTEVPEVAEVVEPSPDEVVEDFLQNRGPVEESREVTTARMEEEEYQELLDEEYSLKLKEEELLAIGMEFS